MKVTTLFFTIYSLRNNEKIQWKENLRPSWNYAPLPLFPLFTLKLVNHKLKRKHFLSYLGPILFVDCLRSKTRLKIYWILFFPPFHSLHNKREIYKPILSDTKKKKTCNVWTHIFFSLSVLFHEITKKVARVKGWMSVDVVQLLFYSANIVFHRLIIVSLSWLVGIAAAPYWRLQSLEKQHGSLI